MDVVILGGGASGAAITAACTRLGLNARLASRSTGFDLTRDDPTTLGPADVFIEATGINTINARTATEFFTQSATCVSTAANHYDALHIQLSIVGCDRPKVRDYGYYTGKIAQENTAKASSRRLSIVRTTQWFEFGVQVMQRNHIGPFGLVPSMRIQPLALSAAAQVLAECAAGVRREDRIDVAGPQELTLLDLARRSPRPRGLIPTPIVLPTGYGKAFRNGGLLPDPGTEVVGPTFEHWLHTTGR
ncbi:MAG: NADH(P)-binding protein [Actinomycetaceae bacterium]|nr:NADH(P)-binding protein [Actinomycetaceae bacterium]